MGAQLTPVWNASPNVFAIETRIIRCDGRGMQGNFRRVVTRNHYSFVSNVNTFYTCTLV